MFARVLIANRGEVAIRVARACAELGVASVAVYSSDDAASLHVVKADQAVALPGGGAAAYLDAENIIAAAQQAGCDALHPGYGFLSENADFAESCAAAGLIFVGPSPAALRLFGDKAKARALAQQCGVPLAAGAAGPTSLVQAYAGARSMSRGAFGSDALYVEELIGRARHIEVQVLGDSRGRVTHLFERECSVQRRHQKFLEIAPSPWLDPALREALTAAALRLAAAGRYVGVGTVEFLVEMEATGEATGRFVFIAMNPRLQVEHTVTEEVTGVDLVATQLRLAGGHK